MLDKTEAKTFVGSDEFINILLAIVENITGNQKILINYALPIIRYIMPVLLSKFWSESNDVKFMSLKIFTDIMNQFLQDPSIFDLECLNGASTTQDRKTAQTMLLNDMIVTKLMPSWVDLLEEPEPVPNIALKLISPLIDKSPVYAELAEWLTIYDYVLEFF